MKKSTFSRASPHRKPKVTEEWVKDYNYERPHDSLVGLSPLSGKMDSKPRLMQALFLPAFPHPTATPVQYQEKILLLKCTENGELTVFH